MQKKCKFSDCNSQAYAFSLLFAKQCVHLTSHVPQQHLLA